MAQANKYWMKLYHETLDDPKIGMLTDRLWRRFIECCLLAGEMGGDGDLPPLTSMAWRLRTTENELLGELEALRDHSLLVMNGANHHVKNFAKRQGPMSKADFMKRKRDQDRKDSYYTVTDGNADIDIDIDKDEDEDHLTAFRELFRKFYETAKIPMDHNPKPKQIETVKGWVHAGILPEDIEGAVEYNQGEGLPCKDPSNIDNGVIIERNKRMKKPKSTADKLREEGFGV